MSVRHAQQYCIIFAIKDALKRGTLNGFSMQKIAVSNLPKEQMLHIKYLLITSSSFLATLLFCIEANNLVHNS